MSGRKSKRTAVKKFAAFVAVFTMILTSFPVKADAEVFFLQNGRRFDSDFYANYYPDVRAKYGYNAGKLLDHYINYGIFERRIPAMYYLYNMDALGLGERVPKEILYSRKSLRMNCTRAEFYNAYNEACQICDRARNQSPLNMYGQMVYLANALHNRITYYPGVKYVRSGPHHNDPCGVFGNVQMDANGVRIPYGADSAGTTRAVGLCLNILCIPYEHVNEGNSNKHQWARVNINGVYFAIDPYVSAQVMPETDYVRFYPPFLP